MQTLRKYLCWVFAFASLVNAQLAGSFILRIVHRYHTPLHLRYLLTPTLMAFQAFVFAMAWWTVWREKPSGRKWGIAASVLNLALPVSLSYFEGFVRGLFLLRRLSLLLVIGVIGLFAFLRPYESLGARSKAQDDGPIPGDGTSELLNKLGAYIISAAALATYFWWLTWLRTKGVPRTGGIWSQIAMLFVVDLVITTLHELGHTITGLTLGMKLRAFIAGPFQWLIRDGKWNFQFNPSAILTPGGATGMIPAVAGFPRWRTISMLLGGPAATLISGSAALITAFTVRSDSPLQAGGLLMLSGAWSLVLLAVNLAPFRTPNGYSDGAQLYQLLSGGPFADLHRIRAVISSSLVTQLRPRDYDIEALTHLEATITRGREACLLRLYACYYFVDTGKLQNATEALRDAESIYDHSASHLPPEICTLFVFGNAYLLHDAVAAREWWTRFEAKKSKRFNVDYWRAASALHWIECNLQQANEAWEKSNALAQNLPKAGAYEFDRYCNSLLREAIDVGCPTSAASAVVADEQTVG